MKSDSGTLLTLAGFFALTSMFAIGVANSTIPEIRRFAVDVQHWLSDRQFADSFALAQITPGPNLIIVTLIGYRVGGVEAAIVSTLAMCAPPLRDCLSGRPHRRALQGRGLAWRDQPRRCPGHARADGGKRHLDRQRGRHQLGGRGRHAHHRRDRFLDAPEPALGLCRRGAPWRRGPHLIARLRLTYCSCTPPHPLLRAPVSGPIVCRREGNQ
jgi:hypothetical protein